MVQVLLSLGITNQSAYMHRHEPVTSAMQIDASRTLKILRPVGHDALYTRDFGT